MSHTFRDICKNRISAYPSSSPRHFLKHSPTSVCMYVFMKPQGFCKASYVEGLMKSLKAPRGFVQKYILILQSFFYRHLVALERSRTAISESDLSCVDFSFCCIIKQFVDSLEQNICCNKTSFHPTNSWTSSGLREN